MVTCFRKLLGILILNNENLKYGFFKFPLLKMSLTISFKFFEKIL